MLPNSVKATQASAVMFSQRRPRNAKPMTVARMASTSLDYLAQLQMVVHYSQQQLHKTQLA